MLLAAQIAAVTGTIAVVTLGGIVGRDLAPTPALATLPMSVLVVGTAVATVPAAWLMSRIGRARGFACGAVVGCAGAGCAVLAVANASFVQFCAGTGLLGFANAFAQQYRFAAAESVSAASAGKAVSTVLAGAMVGAILGPELAARGEAWIDEAPFAGTFVVIAGCHFVAGALLLWLRNPTPSDSALIMDDTRPLLVMARSRMFLVAVLGAAMGHGVMAFQMTATPLAMHVVDEHSLASTATVVQAHVLAMYAPALVTGMLISRFDAVRVMQAGAVVLALGVAVGLAGREVPHYGVAMVALGVGWNFLYVGGTTLLVSAHRPAERFRAQAFNEFAVFGISAVGSVSAGVVMQIYGWNAVLAASMPAVVLVLAMLIWAPTEANRHRGDG